MKFLFIYLFLIINIHCYSNNLDSLLAVLDTATVSNAKKSDLLYEIAKVYFINGDNQKSLPYYKEALLLLDNTDTSGRINCLYNIGGVYSNLGNFKTSLKYYFETLKLVEKINNTDILILLYYNIGYKFIQLEDFEKSKKYLLQSLELSEEIGNEKYYAYSLNLLGACEPYGSETALNYYLKSLNVSQLIKDTANINVVFINLGVHFKERGEYNKAIEYYEKALYIKQSEKMNWVAGLMINIANCKYEMGQYEASIKECKNTLIIAEEHNLLQVKMVAYECLTNNYIKKNMFKEYLEYYEKYTAIKESFNSVNIMKEITEIEMKFDFEKHKLQDSLILKQTQQEYQTKVKNRNNWLLFLGTMLFTLFFFFIIVFVQKRQTLASNKQLVSRNLELISSEQQLFSLKKQLQKVTKQKKNNASKKYLSSPLSQEQTNELMHNIFILMEQKKVFINKNITINTFAEMLNSNRNYVSQVLNEKLNKTFSIFINEFRVKEARKQLSNPANQNLTIEAIAFQAGFGSKSTFNTVFKKQTGITPSFFLKSMKNKEA